MLEAMDASERSPLRFLAPLGLITFIVVLFMILGSYGTGSDGSSSSRGEDDAAPARTEPANAGDGDSGRPLPARQRRQRAGRSVYIVKTGDTLGNISEKAGVTVESIQELNPEVDPQALVAGQRIKLRE